MTFSLYTHAHTLRNIAHTDTQHTQTYRCRTHIETCRHRTHRETQRHSHRCKTHTETLTQIYTDAYTQTQTHMQMIYNTHRHINIIQRIIFTHRDINTHVAHYPQRQAHTNIHMKTYTQAYIDNTERQTAHT